MRKWYRWLMVIAATTFSLVAFASLPDRIATHWNAHGVANGWSSRPFAAFLMPVIMAALALILPALPNIDPRRENYAKFRPTFDLIVNGIITLIAVLHVATLGIALGWPISMERLTPLLIGGLLVLLGNVMPRARPNWWFGIRTPWTLSNDRVWERTHRLGGYLFVAAGVLLILAALGPTRFALPAIITLCVAASVIPLVYSYFAWKQETSR